MENLDQNTQNQVSSSVDLGMGQTQVPPMQSTTSIDPVASPQAGLQERLNQQASGSKKGGKLWLMIVAVLVLVLIGVAGWWYYAQGQAMLLARDIKWDWGQDLKNFRSDINVDLDIKDIKDDSGGLALFGAPSSFKINISNVMHNVDKDFQGSGDYSLFAGGMGIDLSLEYKKIGDTFYIKPDAESLEIPFLPIDFSILNDRWIYLAESDYSMITGSTKDDDASGNDEQMQQKNEQFLKALKDKKAFTIKDPHETKDSSVGKLKKLQFVVKPDMIEEMIITGLNIYSDNPEKEIEDLNKNKADSPEEWEKFKLFMANVQMMVWVNTSTKVIQGAEFAMDNLEYAAEGTSATVDGSISFLIVEEEPIVVSTPATSISVEGLMTEMMEVEEQARMREMEEKLGYSDFAGDFDNDGLENIREDMIGTDPNNEDSDGDGYLDGEEVENGYNPMGEGSLEDWQNQITPQMKLACTEAGGTWHDTYDECNCPNSGWFVGLKGCIEVY